MDDVLQGFALTRRHAAHRRLPRWRGVTALASSLTILAIGAGAIALLANDAGPSAPAPRPAASDLERAALIPVRVPPRPKTSAGTVDASPTIPQEASGTFVPARGSTGRTGTGRLVTYHVEVEVGLPYDAEGFARAVDSTLTDNRGWTKDGAYAFQRNAAATRRIVLASPATVDKLCAPLQTRGEVSCKNGDAVVINALRWAKGAQAYGKDVGGYREYVINHEFGHSLGFGHRPCPADGAPAPVMLQQTRGLDGCERNPWP